MIYGAKTFFLIFLSFTTVGIAQTEKQKHLLYYSSGFSVGNFVGLNLNFNYINNEKYSLMLGYSAFIREASSRPDDFSDGLFGELFTLGLGTSNDLVQTGIIAVGYTKNLNPKGTIRLNLRGGLGLSFIESPYNWRPIERPDGGTNYEFDYRTTSTMSLILLPEIEFPFSRIIGLSIAPFFHLNKEMNIGGIELKGMLGKLRGKNKANVYDYKP